MITDKNTEINTDMFQELITQYFKLQRENEKLQDNANICEKQANNEIKLLKDKLYQQANNEKDSMVLNDLKEWLDEMIKLSHIKSITIVLESVRNKIESLRRDYE